MSREARSSACCFEVSRAPPIGALSVFGREPEARGDVAPRAALGDGAACEPARNLIELVDGLAEVSEGDERLLVRRLVGRDASDEDAGSAGEFVPDELAEVFGDREVADDRDLAKASPRVVVD